MVSLLSKMFIKNYRETQNPVVRLAYGALCGIVGIGLNIVMFIGKFIAGTLTGSIAMTSDAINSLSDAGSSLIMLFGFKIAGKKSDPEHPFGHGRVEYISGLIVSFIIILMGFEIFKSSIEKILHPENVEFSLISVIILVASILIKLYMAFYNRSIGKKIDSAALLATASDSVSDIASTGVVLISTLVGHFTGLKLDGWGGLAVAVFILINGFKSAKETISPLLGQPADPEMVEKIAKVVLSHEPICGMHDLIVNDYGPGRLVVSLHAEVPKDVDIMELHDIIDNVEEDLKEELGGIVVIHMDPIDTNNEEVLKTRMKLAEKLKEIHPDLTIHDFRMVPGPTHTNLIFDAVLPYEAKMTEEEAKDRIRASVKELDKTWNAVVLIDRSYVKV